MNNASNNSSNNSNKNMNNNGQSSPTKSKGSSSIKKAASGLGGIGKQALEKKALDKLTNGTKNSGEKGNSPINNFIKDKAKNAISSRLNKPGGNKDGKPGQNFGKNLLNKMNNTAKPNDNGQGQNKDAEKIKQLTEVAKKIPIPQVQAAAKVVDAANKSGVTDKLTKKDKNGKSSLDKMGITGTFDIKKKILLYSIPLLGLVIIFTAITASFSTSVSASGESVNEGLCVIDGEQVDECEETSPEAKEFHARVKEVRNEFASNGKYFDPLYIAGFYSAVSTTNGSNISYDSMTKGKIEEIVNAMFEEEGTTFDEEIFKDNLKNTILPAYIPNESETEYDHVISEIFDYISRFKDIYGDTSLTSGSSSAARLVQIAQAELDESNTSKYGGEKYWRYMGFNSYVYWCASFVSWCANTAGIDISVIPHSAAVDTFYNYYTTSGGFHTINSGYIPQPGDLIIWKRGQNVKGWSHIGIVERYDSATGKLYTIEGNSSNSVARNIYNDLGGCTGFASPAYPVDDSEASDITGGSTIILPPGLGTYGTREFDLADTQLEIDYSRNVMRTSGKITNPYAFPETSTQRRVQNLWISSGAKHDSKGFCKLNGRYLIAVTTTFGVIGDKIDFYMSNGKVIHGIIGDAKSMGDAGANKWGHVGGQVVLEFMGENRIGDNPYTALDLTGSVTVTKAVNGGTIF